MPFMLLAGLALILIGMGIGALLKKVEHLESAADPKLLESERMGRAIKLQAIYGLSTRHSPKLGWCVEFTADELPKKFALRAIESEVSNQFHDDPVEAVLQFAETIGLPF